MYLYKMIKFANKILIQVYVMYKTKCWIFLRLPIYVVGQKHVCYKNYKWNF